MNRPLQQISDLFVDVRLVQFPRRYKPACTNSYRFEKSRLPLFRFRRNRRTQSMGLFQSIGFFLELILLLFRNISLTTERLV